MDFPAVKARRLLAVLMREPLGYEIARQRGSHRVLVSRRGYPPLVFALLVRDVGLGEDEARRLL